GRDQAQSAFERDEGPSSLSLPGPVVAFRGRRRFWWLSPGSVLVGEITGAPRETQQRHVDCREVTVRSTLRQRTVSDLRAEGRLEAHRRSWRTRSGPGHHCRKGEPGPLSRPLHRGAQATANTRACALVQRLAYLHVVWAPPSGVTVALVSVVK